MKKFKKISALFMASVITAGTISSMSTGAIARFNTKDDFKELFEDAYMIPVDCAVATSTICKDSIYYRNNRTFILETEKDNVYDIYSIDCADPDYISASLESDVDADVLTAAMKEVCPDAEVVNVTQDDDSKIVCVKGMDNSEEWHLPYDEVIKKDITYEQVTKIYDLLNETGKLKSFDYTQVPVGYGLTRYAYTNYWCNHRNSTKLEKVQDYIAENNLDLTVDIKSYGYPVNDDTDFVVTTGKRMSAEENVKLAEQLANDIGIYPDILYIATANVSDPITIDMHNNLKGDANDDDELRLSDAILILQSIGNPDEYQLTAQGRYNADIYGDRDGITVSDAITVQRKILGLE